jgi:hypothetical protein
MVKSPKRRAERYEDFFEEPGDATPEAKCFLINKYKNFHENA